MLGQRNQERATTLTITNTVNFNRTFKDMHHLNVLLGQEAQKISYRTIYAAASGYPSDAVLNWTMLPSQQGRDLQPKQALFLRSL